MCKCMYLDVCSYKSWAMFLFQDDIFKVKRLLLNSFPDMTAPAHSGGLSDPENRSILINHSIAGTLHIFLL